METPNLAAPADTVLTVELLDQQGTRHTVSVVASDWEAALGLTHEWTVFDNYGRPIVASRAPNALMHRARNRKNVWLTLADFIALPGYGETVRFLDADTLNVTRANLVCRPKGARTVPTPPKPPTRKQLELEARLEAIALAAFEPRPAVPVTADETSPPPAGKRRRTRRPGSKRATPGTASPAAGGAV